MSAQRSSEALSRIYFDAHKSATSCIVREHLRFTKDTFAAGSGRTLHFRLPVVMYAATGGPSGLYFHPTQIFEVGEAEFGSRRPRWQVTTRMYEYRILDSDHRELLVYHWQPGEEFAGPDHPHLHVSAALEAQVDALRQRQIQLDKRHLVTGHVSLPAVVRMLITDFDVAPLRHDWREILDHTEAAVRELEAR